MTDAAQPSYELLNRDNPDAILQTLFSLGVCQADETIANVDKAGEGNMNLVLRVVTNRQSLIVKQARPWVEKYPEIAATDQRILAEIDFYRLISNDEEVSSAMPAVIAALPPSRIMILEDLGEASDYITLYGSNAESTEVNAVFEQAIEWVGKLHRCDISSEESVGSVSLRELNHQHIFSIPLQTPPAIDLDSICEGLAEAAESIASDAALGKAMKELGAVYLKGGGPLLHGDYYPGSWLKTSKGFRVIDAEFCFNGPAEFDLGVLAAHWIFCGSEAGDSTIDRACDLYSNEVSRKRVEGFAGAELVRRLIGVAQLPLDADLPQRSEWLKCGAELLLR